jgi:hypothetical protein
MKEGTLLPAALETASNAFAPGWRTFQNLSGYALSRKVEAENWQFFCLAGVLQATAVGLHGQKTLTRAIKHILRSTAMEKYNSLEVTEIAARRFLGVPYLRVSAHLRHVQESILLMPPKDPPGKSAAHVKSPQLAALMLAPAEDPVQAR